MLQRLMMVVFMGVCCLPVMAQGVSGNDDSKFELFTGYSANGYFLNESPTTTATTASGQKVSSFFNDRAGGPAGFEISLDRNFNRYIGLKGDFSSYFETLHGSVLNAAASLCMKGIVCTHAISFKVPLRSFYFTAGPEFKLRNSTRLTPFAHALFGGVASHAEFAIPASGTRFSDSSTRTGFAASFGGGVDVRVSRLVSLRTTADYTAAFLAEPSPAERRAQNHVRASAGILFHFR